MDRAAAFEWTCPNRYMGSGPTGTNRTHPLPRADPPPSLQGHESSADQAAVQPPAVLAV